MSVKKFVSGNGECIQVDYKNSLKYESLEIYHPKKCYKPKYKARTYPIKNNKLRLYASGSWNDKTRRIIKKLKFSYSNGKCIAELKNPFEVSKNWALWKWEIEKVKMNDCKLNVVTAMKDILYWKSDIYPDITTSWTWIYNGKFPLP